MKSSFSKDMVPFMGLLLFSQVSWSALPPDVARIDGSRVVKDAKNLILRNWKEDGLEVQIDILKGSEDILVPSGDIQWSLHWGGMKPFSGLMSLPVVITQNGKVIKRVMLAVKTRIYRNVLVPLKSIDRHDVLKEEAFIIVKSELASDAEPYLTNASSLSNKRASRRLLAHTPVPESTIENVPLIKKGDQVSVIIKNGLLEVAAKGVAKMDGQSGDQILVTNLHSGRTMAALVKNNGQLEVSSKGANE